MRPRLLDLFCGAGGAAMGYHRAGFEVVGVDHRPMPRFPFEFIQGDALEVVQAIGRDFDFIHASPPCQRFTSARVIHGNDHPDLLTPTRPVLQMLGVPWAIENVPGAPMRPDLLMCGSMFPELRSSNGGLRRHRWFEFWRPLLFLVPPCQHSYRTISVFGHGGRVYHGVENWRDVMGIEWMTRGELAQAIPPAYTTFMGEQLMWHLEGAAA